MPLIKDDNYSPHWLLKNAHVNTIYPAVFRKQALPNYTRERLSLKDGDFIDIDWRKNDSNRLVVLCHGLEGSSISQYIIGTGDLFVAAGWDVVAMNYRSCSGSINLTKRMYHSGATDDLDAVVRHVVSNYSSLVVVGFSLGGNLSLKYAGEGGWDYPKALKAIVAVSTPLHLSSSAQAIIQKQNFIYDGRFLKSLYKKIAAKQVQFPEHFTVKHFRKIKNLRDFDEYYTGPLHGMDGAEDYYRKCSAYFHLENIQHPTLIINAKDDTFLGAACYPYDIAAAHDKVHLLATQYGGHVGFTLFGKKHFWIEQRILEFVESLV